MPDSKVALDAKQRIEAASAEIGAFIGRISARFSDEKSVMEMPKEEMETMIEQEKQETLRAIHSKWRERRE